jgi:hypothetical protein
MRMDVAVHLKSRLGTTPCRIEGSKPAHLCRKDSLDQDSLPQIRCSRLRSGYAGVGSVRCAPMGETASVLA